LVDGYEDVGLRGVGNQPSRGHVNGFAFAQVGIVVPCDNHGCAPQLQIFPEPVRNHQIDVLFLGFAAYHARVPTAVARVHHHHAPVKGHGKGRRGQCKHQPTGQ
jgi:hypothetical protein